MMAKPTAFFDAATTNTESMVLLDFIFVIALVMKMKVLGMLILPWFYLLETKWNKKENRYKEFFTQTIRNQNNLGEYIIVKVLHLFMYSSISLGIFRKYSVMLQALYFMLEINYQQEDPFSSWGERK